MVGVGGLVTDNSVLPAGNYTYSYGLASACSNYSAHTLIRSEYLIVNDITPPVQSGHSPSDGATFAGNSVTVTFDTDEIATCRWTNSGIGYNVRDTLCSGSGTTSHSCTINVQISNPGKYINCIDGSGNFDNSSTTTYISYTPVKKFLNLGYGEISIPQTGTLTLRGNYNYSYDPIDAELICCVGTTCDPWNYYVSPVSTSLSVNGNIGYFDGLSFNPRNYGDDGSIGTKTLRCMIVHDEDLGSSIKSVTYDVVSPPTISSIYVDYDTTAPFWVTGRLNNNVKFTAETYYGYSAEECRASLTDESYDDMSDDVICVISDFDGYDWNCDFGYLNGGVYTAYMACLDPDSGANHSSSDNSEVTFYVDSNPPVITIDQIGDDGSAPFSTSVIPTVTVTTDEDAICYWGNNTLGTVMPCSGGCDSGEACPGDTGNVHTCSYTGYVQGSNNLHISCWDISLNSASYSTTFEYDTVPPVQLGYNPIDGATCHSSTSVDVAITLNEIGNCYGSTTNQDYISMVLGGATDCGTGLTPTCSFSGLSQGTNTFYFACADDTDAHANYDASATPYTISVDTIAPIQSNHSPSTTESSSETITFDTELTATCYYSQNLGDTYDDMESGGTLVTNNGDGTFEFVVSGLSDGVDETYYIGCMDTCGRNSTSSHTITPNIDTTPPVITVNSVGGDTNAPYSTSDSSPSISLSTDEDATCYWDTVDYGYNDMVSFGTLCSGEGTQSHTCTTFGFSDSDFYLYFACDDGQGNSHDSFDNEEISFEIDTTNPVQFNHNPENNSEIKTSNPTILFETDELARCRYSTSDLGYSSMVSTCDSGYDSVHSCDVSGLLRGSHVIYLACVDDTDSSPNFDTASTNTELNYTVSKQTEVTLYKGWNLIALTANITNDGGDRTINVTNGENWIGFSSNVSVNLSDVNFTNASGSVFTWAQAAEQGKLISRFASYTDERRIKYVSEPELAMHDFALRPNRGYKIIMNDSGYLTLPGVGSAPVNETYDYDEILIGYSNSDFSYDDAVTSGYAGGSSKGLVYTLGNRLTDKIYPPSTCLPALEALGSCTTKATPWSGVYVWSNYDNVEFVV